MSYYKEVIEYWSLVRVRDSPGKIFSLIAIIHFLEMSAYPPLS